MSKEQTLVFAVYANWEASKKKYFSKAHGYGGNVPKSHTHP